LIEKGKKIIEKHSLSSSKSKKKQKAITKTHVWIRGKKRRKDDIIKDAKGQDLDAYLKQICYQQAEQYIQKYSKKIGYQYNTIKIKKITSRRGSCSSKQNININFSLVHLAPQFIDYVCAHEVCHLQHKHHQKAFRDLVASIYPNYKEVRKQLRET